MARLNFIYRRNIHSRIHNQAPDRLRKRGTPGNQGTQVKTDQGMDHFLILEILRL